MNWTPLKMATLTATSIVILAIAGITLGQDAGDTSPGADRQEFRHPGHRLLLHRADTDRDGVVTRDEWRTLSDEIAGAFEELDADSDGAVTLEQMGRRGRFGHGGRRQHMRHHRGRMVGGMMFRAADQVGNADGSLDRNEWTNFLAETDANSDGILQSLEIHQSLRSLHDDTNEPPAPSVEDLAARFDELDADSDGVISDQELPRMRRHGRAHR
jgi:Ca2+-binding EF-hand superfamily protein